MPAPWSCIFSVIGQSGAEANVAVGIRTRVVQVRIEHTCIRTIVPVATTDRKLKNITHPPICNHIFSDLIHPPIKLPISARYLAHSSYCFLVSGGDTLLFSSPQWLKYLSSWANLTKCRKLANVISISLNVVCL